MEYLCGGIGAVRKGQPFLSCQWTDAANEGLLYGKVFRYRLNLFHFHKRYMSKSVVLQYIYIISMRHKRSRTMSWCLFLEERFCTMECKHLFILEMLSTMVHCASLLHEGTGRKTDLLDWTLGTTMWAGTVEAAQAVHLISVFLLLLRHLEQKRYSPSLASPISRGLFIEGASRIHDVSVKKMTLLGIYLERQWIDIRLYLKEGTYSTLCRTMFYASVTLPILTNFTI